MIIMCADDGVTMPQQWRQHHHHQEQQQQSHDHLCTHQPEQEANSFETEWLLTTARNNNRKHVEASHCTGKNHSSSAHNHWMDQH